MEHPSQACTLQQHYFYRKVSDLGIVFDVKEKNLRIQNMPVGEGGVNRCLPLESGAGALFANVT
jgi:hypothetical protein